MGWLLVVFDSQDLPRGRTNFRIVWLLLLPFALLGVAVGGILGLLRGVVMLPARVLGAR